MSQLGSKEDNTRRVGGEEEEKEDNGKMTNKTLMTSLLLGEIITNSQ